MCCAHSLIALNICVKFHENMSSSSKKVMELTQIVNTQRAITQKGRKPELLFLCSARRLMVFKVCVKFHDNMSSGFKVMERTRKLLTKGNNSKSRKISAMVHVFCTPAYCV